MRVLYCLLPKILPIKGIHLKIGTILVQLYHLKPKIDKNEKIKWYNCTRIVPNLLP